MGILQGLQAKYNKLLLPETVIAKELGLTKKEVIVLLQNGTLASTEIDGKYYVSIIELAAFLGETKPLDFGQHNAGLQQNVAVESMISTENQHISERKDVEVMQYTGSISSLSDGRFMVQINKGKKADGTRDRESKGFRDKTQAQKHLDNRLEELNGVSPVIQKSMPTINYQYVPTPVQDHTYTDKTFEQYAVETLNKGVGIASSRTIEGYRISLMQINKEIGMIKMTDITADKLRAAFNKLSKHYNKTSLKKCFVTTKMIFGFAIENEDIASDPFIKLKCPSSQKVPNPKETAYSDEDIQIIFRESKKYNEVLYPFFAVLECTGMRPGELRALEWSNVDLEAKTVKIVQAATKEYDDISSLNEYSNSRECISVPKTPYSVRTLRLSDLAIQALKDWRTYLDKSLEPMRNSVYVFPSQEGSFRSESSLKCLLQRFRKKAGLEDMGIRFYRFRHTLCTRLILDKQPIPVIKQIMGDNTTDVIMDVYTHVTREQALIASGSYYEKLNEQHLQNAL